MVRNILFTLLLVVAIIGCNNDDETLPVPDLRKTFIPDDNFELALIELGYDDVLDNQVISENIKDVVELDLSGLGIKSLMGIEDFTYLEYLDCNFNDLIGLDVSQNKFLKKLWLWDNELTSLDVSNNKSLETLYCASNELTTLDLSNNTALYHLECWGNKLTSLDVSNKPGLNYVYCQQNQLTSLDLSNSPSLGIIFCNDNELEDLDVSSNKYLFYLFCGGNRLTNLDVSINTSLERMGCPSNQITCIKVNEPQLKNKVSDWVKDDTATWSLECE
ncbi:hypothetical protein LCM02_08255 [Lutimonas saemankumensis]|uniref:leucine-rich repeat domain-containing protein n=1 Tax=Lutimonas saemankumensis TaxID=483016 RepID=UPI001CD7DAA1|nr:hypothetical protein [Lutimonas saemankumensis]MCA0932440.1 hypothetical protein [Lutimonas saemankumensis]